MNFIFQVMVMNFWSSAPSHLKLLIIVGQLTLETWKLNNNNKTDRYLPKCVRGGKIKSQDNGWEFVDGNGSKGINNILIHLMESRPELSLIIFMQPGVKVQVLQVGTPFELQSMKILTHGE